MPPKPPTAEKHNIDYVIAPSERISQGDIYENIAITESITNNAADISISKLEYPFVILMNQDCDLNSDNRSRALCKEESEKSTAEGRPAKLNHDKHLIWLLLVPMYPFEQFKAGSHLSELEFKMSQVSDGTLIRKIKQNEIPRYHYLNFKEGIGYPPMIVDFKHFFTLPVEYLIPSKQIHYKCRISDLYREFLSQRFAFYLSRIGLPDL